VSKCKFADTKLIRIPKIHAAELLEIAHELDEQETENMTGTKPFFSGRIPQDLYDAVEKHREESGETKTEVLIRGLSEYTGVKIMPTDKPKISSYVHQAIYDRFVEFQQEQGCSMSEATEIILAKFFDIPQKITVNSDYLESLEHRISELENKVKVSTTVVVKSERFDGKFNGLEGNIVRQKKTGADIELEGGKQLFLLSGEFESTKS